MPISLFIEQHEHGLAFYINGDLQFHSADEAIYHEYLVIPAVALAIQRFPQTDLRVLICGGGDGLATRDALRFEQVKQIDLVDYNPEVLELARTVFKPYNLGSLENDNVTVYAEEAFEFVLGLLDEYYHVVICDFTYPNSAEETKIYSREWFQEINRVLIPAGIICTNGVSPEKNTAGFWCLYQTLRSADLFTKPLQLDIPSFNFHGYGNWGLFIASPQVITKNEIETISLPNNLHSITDKQLLEAFIFESAIADYRHQVTIHTLESPQLFYYLLNQSSNQENLLIQSGKYIDFLIIEDTISVQIGRSDSLNLESVAQFWLENIYCDEVNSKNSPDINRFLPARHRYHSPKMTSSWVAHLNELLTEIDVKQLLNSLLLRSQELPPQIANELKNIADKINSNQPLAKLSPKMAEFITLLSVTLLMANLVAPDIVFAKGSSSSGSSYSSDDHNFDTKFLGFIMTGIGGFWLARLFSQSQDK